MADPVFADRIDAAERLGDALRHHRDKRAIVLAIPRGAVPMGAVLARRLHAQLDVVLVRKLGAPGNPEFAVGAVDESGRDYVNPDAFMPGETGEYLQAERQRQLDVMRRRRALYTPGRAPLEVAARTVIVVDDGLATGSTMVAALRAVRRGRPGWLVCAVPVASREALQRVRPLADEVVCLSTPLDFRAVGQFYRSFPQVEDDEVATLLRAGV